MKKKYDNVYHIQELRDSRSKDMSSTIKNRQHFIGHTANNRKEENSFKYKLNNYRDGGGGSGMTYVTHDQFNEHKSHMNTHFNNINDRIVSIDNTTQDTKKKVTNIFWTSLGILVATVVGFGGMILTLINML